MSANRDLKVTLVGDNRLSPAFKSAAGDAGGLSSAMGKFGKIAKVGTLAGVVGMGAFAKASVTAGADFDTTLRQMAAVANVPKAQLKDLSNLALKMGADTKYSAQQAADAMLELAKGGLTAAEIKGGALKQTLTLAAAGGLELADAGTVMSNAMNTFGLSAGQAGQVAAALAGGANASSASVESLGQALSQVGPGAKNAGLSLQETVAALAAFANKGIQGSDAGTSLKTMLIRLTAPTGTAAGMMKKLGLSVYDAHGAIVPFPKMIDRTQDALKGMTAEQRNMAMSVIFGSDAIRAGTVLTGIGSKGLAEYTKATSDQAAAQKVADATMAGLKGALEGLGGSWDTLKTRAGLALAPMIEGVARFGTEVLNGLPVAAASIGTFATGIGTMLSEKFAELKPDLTVFIGNVRTTLVDGGKTLVDGVRQGVETGDWSKLGKTIADALTKAFEGLTTGAVRLTAKFGELIKAVKWGDLSVAIGKQVPTMLAGLVIGILNFDLMGMLRLLKDKWFEVLIGVLTVAFLPARVIGKVGEILAKIPFVGSLLKWGLDAVVGFGKGLVAKIGEVLTAMGGAFLEGFRRVFPLVGTGFLAHLRNLPTYVGVIALEVAAKATALMSKFGEALKTGGLAVVRQAGDMVASLLKVFREIAGDLLGVGKDLMAGLARGIISGAGAVLRAIRDSVTDKIPSYVRKALGIKSPSTVFAGIGVNMMKGLALGITSKASDVVAALTGVLDGLKASGEQAVTDMRKAIDAMQSDLDGLIEQRKSLTSSLADGITSGAGDVAQAFKDVADEADPVGALLAAMNAKLVKVVDFGNVLNTLVSMGASEPLIKQLAAAGVEAGGEMAAALLAAGPGAVANLSSVLTKIDMAGQTAGAVIAGHYYDAGINNMTQLIDGMKSKESELAAQVARINVLLDKIRNAATPEDAVASLAPKKTGPWKTPIFNPKMTGPKKKGPLSGGSLVRASVGAGASEGATYNYTANMYGHVDDTMNEQSMLTALRRVELMT